MKFIGKVKKTYPENILLRNHRKAEEELKATGKYARVHCSSSFHKDNKEVVECLVVYPLTKEIRKKLEIKDEEQENNILNTMMIYGVEPCKEKLAPNEFLKKYVKDEPVTPYAISSVERNMYTAGIEARMIECCINPYDEEKTKEINERMSNNLRRTPYTNWSGD